MRLARLSLAALALVAFAACSTDSTGPEIVNGERTQASADPMLTSLFGSGAREAADSTGKSDGTKGMSIKATE